MAVSFDRVSDIYDSTRGLPPEVSQHVTDRILEIVAATPDTQFFEPGIGTGRIAIPIVQRGYALTGVDISENMMQELRRKLADPSHRLTLLQADATALPCADRSFDVALAVHILHLIPNWQQALAEIRRVLKPDGVLLYTHGRMHPSPGEVGFHSGRAAFEQQWRSILANRGVQISEYGATEAEVLALLSQQQAALETVIAAEWQIQQTVGDLLNRYRHRMYSSCWQVPDAVFPDAIAELTAWCQQHYGSLTADFSQTVQFKIVVVRGWASP